MNRLDALTAALEAKREAEATQAADPSYRNELAAALKRNQFRALLTDDTIAALIAVAEAARDVGYDEYDALADPDCGCGSCRITAALAPLVKEETNGALGVPE